VKDILTVHLPALFSIIIAVIMARVLDEQISFGEGLTLLVAWMTWFKVSHRPDAVD
jgi:hypothetical protein